MLLNGKNAIVTGSSRGLGRSIALTLARHGANVATNAVSQIQSAEAVTTEIQGMGRQAIAIQADVSQSNDVERLFSIVLEHFSRIDVLVNNAAAFTGHTFVCDMTEADWDRVIGVNLKGTFLCAQAAAKHMLRQGSGTIINISSCASQVPMSGDIAYVSSKGGIEAMTRALAVDLAPYAIRVIGVAPGHCDTDDNVEWLESDPDRKNRVLGRIPMARLGRKVGIAELVAFLASDTYDYLTGQTIIVDGGLSIWGGHFT
jgi:3-oxoacyl-[acyl-carrier protein] reductase